MIPEANELAQRALALPEDDRAELAGLLFDSLEAGRDEGYEAAWSEEIARRVEEMESGRVKGVSWDEVHAAMLRARNEQTS